MIKEAIILAGGFGTRLREVIGDDLPKPMALVNGHPFLEYVLAFLDRWGVTRVIMATGHLHDAIEQHFGNAYRDMEIVYSRETEPLGTGGAVRKAMEYMNSYSCYVLNGDTYFDVNLWKLDNFHKAREADASMALRKLRDVSRYGVVTTDEDNRLISFEEKGAQSGEGFINGGTYILNRYKFMETDFPEKFSLEKDYFEKYIKEQRFYGVRCYSFFIDIGVPEDYEEAQDALEGLLT